MWSPASYDSLTPSLKYTYKGNYFTYYVVRILKKIGLFINCFISFGIISIVNGLVIRVAIVSSGVIIFPMIGAAAAFNRPFPA